MRRQKPVFSICAEHLLHLRVVHVRGAAGRSRPCHLIFVAIDATKGSAFGMKCRGRLLFILRLKMEESL